MPYELQRFQHRQGEAVLSRDMDDQLRDASQRMWCHNQSVHNSFGIARGFEAVFKDSGRAVVTVEKGEAYDAIGRALILTPRTKDGTELSAAEVCVPTGTGSWVLMARRAAGRGCGSSARDDRSAAPEFVWKPRSQYMLDVGVPLFAVRVAGGSATQEPFQAPRTARVGQPKIARGSTVPGKTPWKPILLPESKSVDSTLFLIVTVDTSDAGFLNYGKPQASEDEPQRPRLQYPSPFYQVCLGGLPESFPALTMEWTVNETASSFDILLWLAGTAPGIVWYWYPFVGKLFEQFDAVLTGQSENNDREETAPADPTLLALAQNHLYARWVGIQPSWLPADDPAKEGAANVIDR